MPGNDPQQEPEKRGEKSIIDDKALSTLFYSQPEVRRVRPLYEIFESMYEKPVVPQDSTGDVMDELKRVTEGVLNHLISSVAKFSGRSFNQVYLDFLIQYAEGVDVDLAVFIPFALKGDEGVRVIPPFPPHAKEILTTIYPFFNIGSEEPEVLEKGVHPNGEVGVFLVLEEGEERYHPTLYANFEGVELLLKNFERSLVEGASSMSVIKNVIVTMRLLEIQETVARSLLDLSPSERHQKVLEAFDKLKGYAQGIEKIPGRGMPLWKRINGEFIVTVAAPQLPDLALFRKPSLVPPFHLLKEARYIPKSYKIKLLGEGYGSGEVRVEPSDDHLVAVYT
ncbi:MAG: hypothetical protein D6780_05045 [Candidatus Dadabacteria bacterium]|nr:MAG: hypothetical protein D6780_05045 [Candidatus Dadabacteria bacterium]